MDIEELESMERYFLGLHEVQKGLQKLPDKLTGIFEEHRKRIFSDSDSLDLRIKTSKKKLRRLNFLLKICIITLVSISFIPLLLIFIMGY